MTISRATIRKRFAERLVLKLPGKVYDYQASDFKGASPVTIVTGSNTNRADQKTAENSTIGLEVHTFVLYAVPPVQSQFDVSAGTGAQIYFEDTSMFEIGQVITIADEDDVEQAEVVSINPNVYIVVDALAASYTTPKVYVWTESQSEDMIDSLEQTIADETRAANDDDFWLSIATGDASTIDVVEIGGEAYRHETIQIVAVVADF